MSRKPIVRVASPADSYAAPNERIFEFSGVPNAGDLPGGLISFRILDDGKVLVEPYRMEWCVVRVGDQDVYANNAGQLASRPASIRLDDIADKVDARAVRISPGVNLEQVDEALLHSAYARAIADFARWLNGDDETYALRLVLQDGQAHREIEEEGDAS